MSNPPVETPAEWLRFAEENLGVAQREMGHESPAFRTVCFLCQSAAEKYLKGYLIAQGWTLEKTHDIVVLLGLCADYNEGFAPLLEGGAILNEYIVAGRYPGDLAMEAINKAEAEEALAIVRQIRELVKKLL
jgi:HEPN domain-containing protein